MAITQMDLYDMQFVAQLCYIVQTRLIALDKSGDSYYSIPYDTLNDGSPSAYLYMKLFWMLFQLVDRFYQMEQNVNEPVDSVHRIYTPISILDEVSLFGQPQIPYAGQPLCEQVCEQFNLLRFIIHLLNRMCIVQKDLKVNTIGTFDEYSAYGSSNFSTLKAEGDQFYRKVIHPDIIPSVPIYTGVRFKDRNSVVFDPAPIVLNAVNQQYRICKLKGTAQDVFITCKPNQYFTFEFSRFRYQQHQNTPMSSLITRFFSLDYDQSAFYTRTPVGIDLVNAQSTSLSLQFEFKWLDTENCLIFVENDTPFAVNIFMIVLENLVQTYQSPSTPGYTKYQIYTYKKDKSLSTQFIKLNKNNHHAFIPLPQIQEYGSIDISQMFNTPVVSLDDYTSSFQPLEVLPTPSSSEWDSYRREYSFQSSYSREGTYLFKYQLPTFNTQ